MCYKQMLEKVVIHLVYFLFLKCAVTKAAVVGNDPTNVIRFSYLYFVNVKKAITELYASNILNIVLSKN